MNQVDQFFFFLGVLLQQHFHNLPPRISSCENQVPFEFSKVEFQVGLMPHLVIAAWNSSFEKSSCAEKSIFTKSSSKQGYLIKKLSKGLLVK